MLDWLNEHGSALNVLINFAILVVWLVYLQLFLQSYRRARRPKILISRGIGEGLRSHCLLSNMSAESIYIHSLIATLDFSERRYVASVTDLVEISEESHPTARDATIQGPVSVGGFVDVGAFEDILRRAGWSDWRNRGGDGAGSTTLELTVIATYGSEDLIVGAQRLFDIERREGDWVTTPRSPETRQIRSRAARKALSRTYMSYMN